MIVIGRHKLENDHYVHYLHHKYFEVNYGADQFVPLDKWFGTFHDGSEAAQQTMLRRLQRRHVFPPRAIIVFATLRLQLWHLRPRRIEKGGALACPGGRRNLTPSERYGDWPASH